MLASELLLENEEIKQCLNFSVNDKGELDYPQFRSHWCNFELNYTEGFTPTEKQAQKLLEDYTAERIAPGYLAHWWVKVERIAKTKQCEKINGQVCDIVTANMLYTLLTKLNDKNKEKLLSLDFAVAVHLGWQVMAKASNR